MNLKSKSNESFPLNLQFLRNKNDFENLDAEAKALVNVQGQFFHTDVHAYLDSKRDFITRIANNEWHTFEDYLIHYNNLDTSLLCEGTRKYIQIFQEEFGLSPLQSWSMPSMSSKLAFSSYDKRLTSIFTFSQAWGKINSDFRTYGLQGGLTGNLFIITKF